MLTIPVALTRLIVKFAPLFSKRVWEHVEVLVVGALLAPGKRTVTAVLRVSGGRADLSAGFASTGDLPLQACADSGHRLPVVAQEQTPAVPPPDCPGVRGALPRDERDPAGTGGSSLHGGGAHRASHRLLAAGRAESHPALSQCGGGRSSHKRTRIAQD